MSPLFYSLIIPSLNYSKYSTINLLLVTSNAFCSRVRFIVCVAFQEAAAADPREDHLEVLHSDLLSARTHAHAPHHASRCAHLLIPSK